VAVDCLCIWFDGLEVEDLLRRFSSKSRNVIGILMLDWSKVFTHPVPKFFKISWLHCVCISDEDNDLAASESFAKTACCCQEGWMLSKRFNSNVIKSWASGKWMLLFVALALMLFVTFFRFIESWFGIFDRVQLQYLWSIIITINRKVCLLI